MSVIILIILIHFVYDYSGGVVSVCGKYFHVFVRESCQDCLWYYVPLDGKPIDKQLNLIPIIKEFTAECTYVTNDGDMCYIRTNRNAPNFRLVQIDVNIPEEVICQCLKLGKRGKP